MCRLVRGGGFGSVLLFGLVATTRPVMAQGVGRTLAGTVTDKGHEPLVGAVVQLHDDVTDTVISFITTPKGSFDFKRLNTNDDYSVWATYRGHKSKVESMSRFDSKPNKVIVLVIELD